jgi:hypothetical protein
MDQKDYSQMTDIELLDEAKRMKRFSIANALLIGFLAGVVAYSIFKSTWGMLTIIPIYFIYKMINDPRSKKVKELQGILKKRNLQW